MANFTGINAPEIEKSVEGRRFPLFPPLANDPMVSGAFNSIEASITLGTSIRPGIVAKEQQAHNAIDMDCSVDKQIFGGFWIIPTEINADLIIETTETEILVWNSDVKNELAITQIQAINPNGTILNSPPVPILLPRNGSQLHKVTILKDGPAVQSTQYIYTAGVFTISVNITGQRILAFNYEPNWARGVVLSY